MRSFRLPFQRAGFSRLIFPGARDDRPMSNTAMLYVLQQLGEDVTVHGFRSSFRDWCGDHAVPREIAEAALAHLVGSDVERAYLKLTTGPCPAPLSELLIYQAFLPLNSL
jgi:integrase